MSKITEDMIHPFNEMLQEHGSAIRLVKSPESRDAYHIRLAPDPYITNTSLVYPTDQFYEMMRNYFASYGIRELSFNNTRTAFWAYN